MSGRRGMATLALAVALTTGAGLAGCTLQRRGAPADPAASSAAAPAPATSTPGPSATSGARSTDPGSERRNDIDGRSTRRVVRASGLTVTTTYTPRLPTKDWTASVNKPLSVSLTAKNDRQPAQKIYLTRVTLTMTARDDSGPLDSPRPLVDSATITPGFLVTSPYTYGQDFVVPALDEGATSVTLDVTYEFLLQVGKDSRDYYKQTAIDSLVVPIRS